MVEKSQSLDLIVEEIINDQRKLKKLVSGLYNHNMQQRLISAKVLGMISKVNPEFIKNM